MGDQQEVRTLQIRSLPGGGARVMLDGITLPACEDITLWYRPKEDEFRATITIAAPELKLDAEAIVDVKAALRYSGPFDTEEERQNLRCNTSISTVPDQPFGQVSGVTAVKMELVDLLAIVAKWHGRQSLAQE